MNHYHIPAAAPDAAFCTWVGTALPGQILEYHRGFLILDAYPGSSPLPEPERKKLWLVGRRAYWAAEQGLVHLLQRRLAPSHFSYVALMRLRPRGWSGEFPPVAIAERAS